MSKTLPLSLVLALGLLPALGCNFGPGSSSGDDDDSVGDDDDTVGDDPVVVTIEELHDGEIADGTFITIEGVVVTTPMLFDEDDNEGSFWIAQSDGGPKSGLFIYTFYDVVQALRDADAAEPGDVIDITGTYIEAFDYGLPELRLTSENNLDVVGTTNLPTPYEVDASDISGGFADSALWGTVVAVTNTTVDQAPSYDTFNEWTADGVIVTDDFWYADVGLGYTIDRLVGVLHPNYGDASVFPRWAEDVEYSYPGCQSTWTQNELQGVRCRVVDEETEVTLLGLVVTSPATFFGGFYVQDLDVTGNFSGAQLYPIFDDLPVPAIGSVVNFTGEVEVYRGQTELVLFNSDDLELTGANRAGDIVPLEIADPCTLSEEHEGMLVSVPSATVEEYDFFYPFAGCDTVGIGSQFWDDLSAFESETGGAGTVTDLVGVVSVRFDERTINPRDEDDWATWGASTSAW